MPFQPGNTIGKRWRKGESGNPLGRSKIDFDLAEAARAHSPQMLQVAVDIALDESMPPDSRLRAISIILDRGHGRAPLPVALEGKVEQVDTTKIFIEALREHSAQKMLDATPPVALPAE